MGISLDFESCVPIFKYWDSCDLYFILKVKTETGYEYINLKINKTKPIEMLYADASKIKGIKNLKYTDYSTELYKAVKRILNDEEETVYYCGTTDKKVIVAKSYVVVDDGIEIDHDDDMVIVNIGSKQEKDILGISISNCPYCIHGQSNRVFIRKLKDGIVVA